MKTETSTCQEAKQDAVLSIFPASPRNGFLHENVAMDLSLTLDDARNTSTAFMTPSGGQFPSTSKPNRTDTGTATAPTRLPVLATWPA